MRYFFFFLPLFVVLSSCSKDEDIAYIHSVSDTISPNFYHDLMGLYSGTITEVTIDRVSQPGEIILSRVGPSVQHEVNVKNIDFSNVAFDDITNFEDVGAISAIQRINSDAYLAFDPNSLDNTLSPVNLYSIEYSNRVDSFNGFWSTSTDTVLIYFVKQVIGTKGSDYFFEGKKL